MAIIFVAMASMQHTMSTKQFVFYAAGHVVIWHVQRHMCNTLGYDIDYSHTAMLSGFTLGIGTFLAVSNHYRLHLMYKAHMRAKGIDHNTPQRHDEAEETMKAAGKKAL